MCADETAKLCNLTDEKIILSSRFSYLIEDQINKSAVELEINNFQELSKSTRGLPYKI